MAKKICCCKDETQPPVALEKHYIAIPCWEYNSNIYSDITLGIKNLYRYPTQSPVNPSVVAGFTNPVKITSMSTVNGTYVCSPDYDRMSRVMLRGGGGGSNTGGSGGNGAYIDANIVPSKINPQANQIGYFIGAGGTGPILPYDFSVSTTTILSGGPAQPMSGRGGAAASVGPNSTSPYLFFAAGGGGAGSTTGSNGGHGGVIEGHDGLGDRPGIGGSQLYGGTFGDTQAFRGSFPSPYIGGRGSYSWLPTVDPTLSNTSGGGGGAGWKGGGGGGQKSGGGGGSSSLEPYSPTQTTYPDKIEVVVGADGTNIGPGNRCSPYFTFNYDPGLGANRSGRYIAGNTFFTPYRGTNSQVASYFKKRWCVGSESQSTEYPWGNVTGVLSDTEPLHICLTQAQYDVIIANMPGEAAPIANTSQTQLKGVRLSFELNQQKYILAQINDLNCKNTQNHYSCTLSCESNFLEDGTPSNVKFYIPSVNFGTIKDSVNWFKANWPTYDFRNVTSCCDKIVAEPICIGGYGNYCTGTVDINTGVASGCLCDRPPSPPITSGNKPSGVNGAYIHRAEDGWYFLCLPAFGWANYGDSEIVKRYTNDRDDVYSPILNFTGILSPNITTNAPSINLATLKSIYCQDQGGGQNTCTNQSTYWNEEDCKPILLKRYPYRDFYGINQSIFISGGGSCCIRGCMGYGWCTRPSRFLRQSSGVNIEAMFIPELSTVQCSYQDPDLENCGQIRCGPPFCPPVPACCDPSNPPCEQHTEGGGQGGGQGGGGGQLTTGPTISKTPIISETQNQINKKFLQTRSVPRYTFDSVKGIFKRNFSAFQKFVYNVTENVIEEQQPYYLTNQNLCGDGPGQSSCSLAGDEQVSKKVVKIQRGCPPSCAFALCGLPPWTCSPLCACKCQLEVAGIGDGGCSIVETASFEAEMCYAQRKVDKIETTEIFSITLPSCLFPNIGATPEELLTEAQKYIKLEPATKTIQYSFTINATITGTMLKMCPKVTNDWSANPFELFIASAPPEDIVSKINNCLSGITARLINPELDEKKYYWFGKRFFTYFYTNENGQSFPKSISKPGDELIIKRAYREPIGSQVTVVFEAKSNEARTFHGAYKASPLTNDGGNGGRAASISFKDDNSISIREWAQGLGSINMRQAKFVSVPLGICQGSGPTTYDDYMYCVGDLPVDSSPPPEDPDYFDYIGNQNNCDYCFINRIDCYASESDLACDPSEQGCCMTECPLGEEATYVGCPGSMLGVCQCKCAFCNPCYCGPCSDGTVLSCGFPAVWYTGSWCQSSIGGMYVQ